MSFFRNIIFTFFISFTFLTGASIETTTGKTILESDLWLTVWSTEFIYFDTVKVFRSRGEDILVTLPPLKEMTASSDISLVSSSDRSMYTDYHSDSGISFDVYSYNTSTRGQTSASISLNGGNLQMDVSTRSSSNNVADVTVMRVLNIPWSVSDDVYKIPVSFYLGNQSWGGDSRETVSTSIEVITIPEISVGDIDFGVHMAGSDEDLSEATVIDISGGLNNDFLLRLSASKVNLKRGGTRNPKIPVLLSINGYGLTKEDKRSYSGTFNSSGEFPSPRLEAVITDPLPDTPGSYSATVTLTIENN